MPTDTNTDYECAISGKYAAETDLVLDDENDEAGLDALPIGWIKITAQRRGVNPAWLEIQKRKARQLAGMQAQIPEGDDADRAEQIEDVKMAVDAAFFAIEKGTPKYVVIEASCVVLNPDANKQVGAEWKGIASVLSLDVSGS
jgi:hypothetical protein